MRTKIYKLTCEGNRPVAVLAPSETIARMNGIQMFNRPENQEIFSEQIQPAEPKPEPGEIDRCPACGLRDVKPMLEMNENELDEILDLNNLTILEAAQLCICGQCGYNGNPDKFIQDRNGDDDADDLATHREMMREYYSEF